MEKLEESIKNLEKDFLLKESQDFKRRVLQRENVSKKSDVTVSPTLGNCVPKFLAEDKVNESVWKQKCGWWIGRKNGAVKTIYGCFM